MLVLSRKEKESILIGDEIEIVVLSIRDHRVRLGIVAPKELEIVRNELITEEELNG